MKKFVKLDRTEALFTAYALQEYMRNYDEASELKQFLDSLLFKIEKCLLGSKTVKQQFEQGVGDTSEAVSCDNMASSDAPSNTCCSVGNRAHHMFPVFMQFSNVKCHTTPLDSIRADALTLTFKKNESTHNVELHVSNTANNVKLHTFYDVCEVKYDSSTSALVVFETMTFPSMHVFSLSNESDRSFCKMLINNGTIYKKDTE